jgi:hypothetical protein
MCISGTIGFGTGDGLVPVDAVGGKCNGKYLILDKGLVAAIGIGFAEVLENP